MLVILLVFYLHQQLLLMYLLLPVILFSFAAGLKHLNLNCWMILYDVYHCYSNFWQRYWYDYWSKPFIKVLFMLRNFFLYYPCYYASSQTGSRDYHIEEQRNWLSVILILLLYLIPLFIRGHGHSSMPIVGLVIEW